MSGQSYKPEDKLRIAKACSEGKKSRGEAGAEVGADESTVRDWVRQYEAEGAKAFLSDGSKQYYSPGIKMSAVRDYH